MNTDDIDKKIAGWEIDLAYWTTDKTRLLDEAVNTCQEIIDQLKACREENEKLKATENSLRAELLGYQLYHEV